MLQEGHSLTEQDVRFLTGYPIPARYLLAVKDGEILGGQIALNEAEDLKHAARLHQYYPPQSVIYSAEIVDGHVRNIEFKYRCERYAAPRRA